MMRMTSTMAGRSTRVLLVLLCARRRHGGAQQPLESHTTPASAPGAVIPVAEVATQATEVATLLRTVRTEVVPSPALATIHTGLPEVSATIDLPVGVNYGAVPQHVIALLETVARAHPQVLPEPPPRAFFMGYGDSAINFQLRAWPDHFAHWLQVKSDLTAAVYEAVSAAGLSFRFPSVTCACCARPRGPRRASPCRPALAGGGTEGRRTREDWRKDSPPHRVHSGASVARTTPCWCTS